MTKFFAFISLGFLLLLSSCGGGDTFRINGEVEGLGTRSLKFYYYDGDRLKTGMATALDGKFQYEGRASRPVLITISTNQGQLIGHLMAENGDAIKVKYFADKPMLMEISGNGQSEKYASFVKDNYELVAAGASDSLDVALEKFLNDNPRNLASAMAMVIHYNIKEKPMRADSILGTLEPKFRPNQISAGFMAMVPRFAADSVNVIEPMTLYSAGDSMTTITPTDYARSLIIFYNNRDFYTDSICTVLEELESGKDDERTAILNVSLAYDTLAWKKPMREKPVAGLDLWMPGSISSPALQQFNLNAIPTVMVLDSVGSVIYKGDSFDQAMEQLGK